MRAGGFPGNPGGLVVSIVKTAGGRAPAHQARGRGRSTWRPTERSRRCSDGTAGRRQRSAGGWTARSRSVSEYRRSGGIEPTRPRGGKGAPAGGTGGGKDGQHTEVGSRLHVTTTDSRTGQTSLRDGGGHRLASWTSGYATARSEAICRGAGCGRTRTSGSVGGQGQQRPWSTRPKPTAMTATARKLALLVYRMLKYNMPYHHTSAADVSQTEGKSVIEENSVGDDLWGKTESAVDGSSCFHDGLSARVARCDRALQQAVIEVLRQRQHWRGSVGLEHVQLTIGDHSSTPF